MIYKHAYYFMKVTIYTQLRTINKNIGNINLYSSVWQLWFHRSRRLELGKRLKMLLAFLGCQKHARNPNRFPVDPSKMRLAPGGMLLVHGCMLLAFIGTLLAHPNNLIASLGIMQASPRVLEASLVILRHASSILGRPRNVNSIFNHSPSTSRNAPSICRNASNSFSCWELWNRSYHTQLSACSQFAMCTRVYITTSLFYSFTFIIIIFICFIIIP